MDVTRIKQVVSYGWQHAGVIQDKIEAGETSLIKGRLSLFIDILHCYSKYRLWSNQYLKDKFYNLSTEEKDSKGNAYLNNNLKKAEWTDYFYANKRFFARWKGEEHDFSYKRALRRNQAYQKQYGLGDNCKVRSNVLIMSTHNVLGKISVGKNCMFGRNADIDYTGDLTIEDNVSITENVVIMTHNHEITDSSAKGKAVIKTPLIIRDNVMIGANSIIMPGVHEIGRHAMISVGSVVKSKVPPYAIVMGNPAKIIGFKWAPSEIIKYEAMHYPEDKRIPLDQLENNHRIYFISKIKVIKEFIKKSF